jgi:hypothetical protein
MNQDVQALLTELMIALGLHVHTGQITLNLNHGRLETCEVRIKTRVRHGVARERPTASAGTAYTQA